MRTLAITQNITVDGAVEMLGDWFDPTASNAEQLAELHRQTAASDALVLGRQTFEDFRGYWPEQVDDRTGITDSLNRQRKYVVSATMTEPGWQNSTVLAGDPVALVAELKARPGADIVVTGSIRLSHALIEAGLVDEYRLFAYPTVQGAGRRLFPDGYEMPRLRLVESRVLDGVVVYSRYAVER
ncbi:dihydrofolate reductase family protein [Nocardia asteroides]|uniref:dihydrofolate reductase family protein n=1 Tax=Nocardia asteroides TaxID=1824 RepID=UPI001E65D4EA|nr:dihydrofolate reductase family protein [Nocardia asteroides]UGT52948.1 dihydrofolate reductase family protein [Nocardia asteroides]